MTPIPRVKICRGRADCAENVARAIEQVGPYRVDVNPWVSVYRGKKLRDLVEQLIRAAKRSAVESVPPR